MEGEQTAPTTAAPAVDGGTEAQNTNANPAPEAPEAPAADNTHTITVTDEQMSFINGNGGLEKMWPKIKRVVSDPTARAETQPAQTQPEAQTQAQFQPQPQVSQAQEASNPTAPSAQVAKDKGLRSQQELVHEMYVNSVASDPKYANIAEDIRSGKVINEMRNFGIMVFDQDGNMNVDRFTSFLDMYSKTRPAVTPTQLETPAPQVNYTTAPEGGFTDAASAMKAFSEPGNPNREAAIKYLKENFGKTR